MAQRIIRQRRVRPLRGTRTTLAKSEKMRMLEESLKSIAKNIADINYLSLELERQKAQMFIDMKEAKIPRVEIEKAYAEVLRKMGRGSRLVDPKKFFNSVSREEFFDCISVSVTKAEGVLSGKELSKVVTNIPGKAGPEELVIKVKDGA